MKRVGLCSPALLVARRVCRRKAKECERLVVELDSVVDGRAARSNLRSVEAIGALVVQDEEMQRVLESRARRTCPAKRGRMGVSECLARMKTCTARFLRRSC